ncbi:MAG: D-alanyl-D-alanine carboxypeptidase [Ruminococcaceae bacterium]|nr:D-alanyl-D-alanine carboxypeptidase [Oscillospiraceae bacterium]
MYKKFSFFLTLVLLLSLLPISSAAVSDKAPFDVNADSAVLMDYNTGTVLYAKNADLALPPASVTKIMTLLLIMEEVDSGNLSLSEEVSVSEYAASMGGSQVYLEPGETMQAEELLKCVIIASANDAAVTLAEKVAGSEEAFVARMNERAAELGMNNTHFENVTGLDDDTTSHLTSAYDIALMSRELISHPTILKYSTIWMDSIRDGAFGLTNTNRLIRFYNGATGLKTGSTSKAGFCISATAEREGLHLIAVIMGSDTRDIRNEAARQLLDYGFANYSIYTSEGGSAGEASVMGGIKDTCGTEYPPFSILLPKGKGKNVTTEVLIPEGIKAPIQKGDRVGSVKYFLDGAVIAEFPVLASENVDKIGFFGIFEKMLGIYLLK